MKKNTVIRRLAVAGVMTASIVTSFQLYSQHQDDQQAFQVLQDDYKNLESVKNVLSDEVSVLHKENKSLESNLKKTKGKVNRLKKEVKGLQINEKAWMKENATLVKANQALKGQAEPTKKQVSPIRSSVSKESESGTWTTFKATYYDANEPSTGKSPGDSGYGLTASGEYVKAGVTLAVDKNIIPLGTWVLLKYPDGRTEKRQAQDTGSAIHGYKVDIYIPHATLSSGKHNVQIKILGKE